MLCLGLAIGVNTSIFSVLNSVLFRPMPVEQPERLIGISSGKRSTFSYPTYRDFRDRSQTLSGLTASFPCESDLDIDGKSTFVAAEAVSANYASVIGARTALGRWFATDAEPVAVVSYAVVAAPLQPDPDVLGRTVRSESQTYTVIGVAPREFNGIFSPLRTDIWVPVATRPSMVALLRNRSIPRVMLFGRLQTATPLRQWHQVSSTPSTHSSQRKSPLLEDRRLRSWPTRFEGSRISAADEGPRSLPAFSPS